MRSRLLATVVLAAALAVVAAGCGGSSGGGGGGGETTAPPEETAAQDTTATTSAGTEESGQIEKGGILRIGTVSYIDSFNPFNYIASASFNAFVMVYPQLVQYGQGEDGNLVIVGDWAKSWETSADGLDWTFTVYPDTKWSDGTPLTADDAAWTINTTVQFADGPTAVAAPALAHVKNAEAPDDTTLVIHYDQPVGNVLEQLEQFFVLPRHVYEPLAAGDGKELKRFKPDQHLPLVSAGAFTLKQYERKGTTVFLPDPNYWGTPANAEAVALTYYTNSDSMIAGLQQGDVDWVDQVPFNAVDVLKGDSSVVVNEVPGAETTNVTWNSNPRKPQNRELLDPQVKKALSMCIDRERIIEVVFSGYATTVESLVGHVAGDMENPNLGPLEYDCAAGNQMLDELGYTRGPDGIRVAPATTGEHAQPAHPMKYEVITPSADSIDFNVDRSFEIVKEGFAEAGVELTQKVGGDSTQSYLLETDDDCDAATSTGYATFDIAMWDWVGYIDPDFMLSVVTKGQWCSWSDTGWDDPDYDALYQEQGVTVDREERQQIVWEMQQMIYDNVVYTQLTNHELIDAHSDTWTGIHPELAAYNKEYWTLPGMVG